MRLAAQHEMDMLRLAFKPHLAGSHATGEAALTLSEGARYKATGESRGWMVPTSGFVWDTASSKSSSCLQFSSHTKTGTAADAACVAASSVKCGRVRAEIATREHAPHQVRFYQAGTCRKIPDYRPRIALTLLQNNRLQRSCEDYGRRARADLGSTESLPCTLQLPRPRGACWQLKV